MKLHLVPLYSNSLQSLGKIEIPFLDEKHTRRSLSTVVPKNALPVRKMLIDDNHCTYQMIQEELSIVTAAIHKIIHELQMKKLICRLNTEK